MKKLNLFYKKPNTGEQIYKVKTPALSALCLALMSKHQKILYIPEDKWQEIKKEIKYPDLENTDRDHLVILFDSGLQFTALRSDKYEKGDIGKLIERGEKESRQHIQDKIDNMGNL